MALGNHANNFLFAGAQTNTAVPHGRHSQQQIPVSVQIQVNQHLFRKTSVGSAGFFLCLFAGLLN
jgi:hypothetical protein